MIDAFQKGIQRGIIFFQQIEADSETKNSFFFKNSALKAAPFNLICILSFAAQALFLSFFFVFFVHCKFRANRCFSLSII